MATVTTVVTLQLTEEEAQALVSLLHFVGGSPTKSRRRYTDPIRQTLFLAGTLVNSTDLEGHLYFVDEA